jgi:heme A synthase
MIGAALVSACVFWLLTVALVRHPDRRALQRPALLLATLLLGQVGLGLLAARTLNGEQVYTMAQVLLPTAHQALGALMFATSLIVVLRTLRRLGPVGKVVAA